MKAYICKCFLAFTLIASAAYGDETLSYTYDARGRLIQVLHNGAINQGATTSYQYDLADNRKNMAVTTMWTSPAFHTRDINGDGYADVLWRHNDGTVTDWLGQPNGTLAGNSANFNTAITNDWHILGIGDFNGDGRADMLWQNDDGTLTDWLGLANGAMAGNGTNFSTVLTGDWKVVGIGDFNGDGKADLLLRNSSGYLTEWLGNSAGGFTDNSSIAGTGAVDNTWHIVGIGDFNGDGRSDILWRNDNGLIVEWLANPNGSFAGNSAVNNSVTADWKVIGIGDFNCDGRADILWRNDNGDLTEWQATSSGTFITTSMPYYSVPTNLRVALIGDFNGDRCDDLLWRDTVGNVTEWLGGPGGSFRNNSAENFNVTTDWNIEPK